ncbi:hypothetical protein LUZ60_006041 [Juncus effusus]|nr:hypothetical protein LUZ60_006041 [Juncus effusus]
MIDQNLNSPRRCASMANSKAELSEVGLVGEEKVREAKRKWWFRRGKNYKQLVEYHSLPGYLKDNEYILKYYRAEWPIRQTLMSVFSIHNETLNVWTHLIGFFLFLALTIYTANQIPKVVDLQTIQHLPDVIKKELIACIPHFSDLNKLRNEIKNWRLMEILSSCLPYGFNSNSNSNFTNLNVLKSMKDDVANIISPLVPQPISRWPFFVFLSGAMFCLLASSTCHLLSCHSKRVSYIMLRIDYAGISALIASSFYPPVYYSFLCHPFFLTLYLSIITVLGVATVGFSLLPVFQSPEFRVVRAGLFFGMGVSGVVPVLHKLVIFWDRPEALHTTGYEILMGLLYGLGALVYATRIPERWMPGKFDIAGHSHQLFHILVVAGAYTHYHAGLVYLKWRDLEGC